MRCQPFYNNLHHAMFESATDPSGQAVRLNEGHLLRVRLPNKRISNAQKSDSARLLYQAERQGLPNLLAVPQPTHTGSGDETLPEDIHILLADCNQDGCRESSQAVRDWIAWASRHSEATAHPGACVHRYTLCHAAALRLHLFFFALASPALKLTSYFISLSNELAGIASPKSNSRAIWRSCLSDGGGVI